MIKIAVLGSNSFSGSHFVNYALDNTEAQIIGISRSSEPDSTFLPYAYKKERSARFSFHRLDLNKDLEDILGLLDKERPETIINFASQGEVRNSWRWPEQWYQTNVVALVNLANQLKDRSYIRRFVEISTPEVYGSTGINVKEGRVYSPGTPYGASRAAGDQFLELIHRRNNFPVVFTRAANVYGPHQQLFRIIPKTIIQFKKGEKIELHGGGKSERAFIHIKDVADATLKIAQDGKQGEVYHISPDEQTISIYDLVNKIACITSTEFDKMVIVTGENFGQDALYSLSSEKIANELNWKPKISLDDGINQVVEWVNDNWEIIKDLPVEYIHKP